MLRMDKDVKKVQYQAFHYILALTNQNVMYLTLEVDLFAEYRTNTLLVQLVYAKQKRRRTERVEELECFDIGLHPLLIDTCT